MFRGAKLFLKKFAEKILDVDDTSKPESQLRLLEGYSERFKFEYDLSDIDNFLKVLKKKHLVDEIVVSTLHGSAIGSTNGDSVSQAVSSAALFNYVKSELPKSEALIVKSNGWHMIFNYGKKLYIVKASSNLNMVELKALAREIESFLEKNAI